MKRARIVLFAGAGLAVVFTVQDLVLGFHGSPNWPGNAAQIIATLLLAAVVEDRLFDRTALDRSSRVVGIFLFSWAWAALLMCADAGGRGKALPQVGAAIVDGAILGLGGLVLASAIASMLDDEG